jgi:hypothetical protein
VLGGAEGATVGEVEGLSVGAWVGVTDGAVEGACEGVVDGVCVGATLGLCVGAPVGVTEGPVLGAVVGACRGCCEGRVLRGQGYARARARASPESVLGMVWPSGCWWAVGRATPRGLSSVAGEHGGGGERGKG